MDTRKTIGWNIRRLRVAKGLSQEKLALEAGIDRSYVGRIERGTENVTVSALETLALILNVPVSELFSEFDDATSQPSPLPSGRKPRTP
jgi:transcriptional regulator with XRE-family HTH domain